MKDNEIRIVLERMEKDRFNCRIFYGTRDSEDLGTTTITVGDNATVIIPIITTVSTQKSNFFKKKARS